MADDGAADEGVVVEELNASPNRNPQRTDHQHALGRFDAMLAEQMAPFVAAAAELHRCTHPTQPAVRHPENAARRLAAAAGVVEQLPRAIRAAHALHDAVVAVGARVHAERARLTGDRAMARREYGAARLSYSRIPLAAVYSSSKSLLLILKYTKSLLGTARP